jgi:hypothetical protein
MASTRTFACPCFPLELDCTFSTLHGTSSMSISPPGFSLVMLAVVFTQETSLNFKQKQSVFQFYFYLLSSLIA